MKKIYDLLIIGGGPAGLSAFMQERAKLKTIILEKGTGGGQAATTSEIANYPGIRIYRAQG
jgi:thioredoxin reductase (NADPH)